MRKILATLCALVATSSSAAPIYTAPGVITHFGAGYDTGSVFIRLSITHVNMSPTPCNSTDYYSISPSGADATNLKTVLMNAYLHGKAVQLTLDGCVFDYPRIVGVVVLP